MAVKGTNMQQYLGIAAADRSHNSRDLLVQLPEMQPFLQGEYKAMSVTNNITTSDGKSQHTSTLTTSNYITCTYKGQPNRLEPPYIRKGEQVLVTKFGDDDRWYWEPEGRDENLRRLDKLRFGISGTLENKSEQTDDNTYYIELDSLENQNIVLSTSQANGELHRYKIELNAKNSTAMVTDEKGNFWTIESEENRIRFQNADRSCIALDKKNILLQCEGDIVLNAKNNIAVNTQTGTFDCNSAKQCSFNSGEGFAVTAADAITETAGGAWAVAFGGNGSCKGKGNLNMVVGEFTVDRG